MHNKKKDSSFKQQPIGKSANGGGGDTKTKRDDTMQNMRDGPTKPFTP